MAISTSGITVLNQDGSGTWSDVGGGGGSAQNTDVFFSSTGTRARKVSNAIRGFLFDNGTGIDLTNEQVAIRWATFAGVASINTRALGGVRIRIGSSTTNYDEWYVDGNDTYGGGWKVSVIDLSKTPSATGGTGLDVTNCQFFGIVWDITAGVGGGDPNCYIDSIIHFEKLTIAGTSTTLFDEILTADEGGGWGIFQERSGSYFAQCLIELNNTGLDDDGATVVFENPEYYDGTAVASALSTVRLGLQSTANGGGDFGVRIDAETGVEGCLFFGNGLPYTFDFALGSFDFYGCTIEEADAPAFAASPREVLSTIFFDCGQIAASSAVFRNVIVANSTDAGGALLWDSNTDMQDSSFLNNTNAVEIDTAGTYSMTDVVFSGNTTDINNTSGGSVTVNASGTANPTTSTGTTTIVASKTLNLTGIKNPSEVRVYDPGTPPLTEIAGQENVTTGTFNTSIDSATYPTVTIAIINNQGFQNVYLEDVDMSTDRDIPVFQPLDRQDTD